MSRTRTVCCFSLKFQVGFCHFISTCTPHDARLSTDRHDCLQQKQDVSVCEETTYLNLRNSILSSCYYPLIHSAIEMSTFTTTTTPRAGGGVDSTVDQEKRLNLTSPSILKHIEALALTDTATHRQDILEDYLSSPSGNAQAPPLSNDLNYPLPNYFISSSHNTYLSGNQLSSDSSALAYRNVSFLLLSSCCNLVSCADGYRYF